MKNSPAVAVVLSLFVAVLVGPAPSRASSGTESASFLEIPVGAGPAALGGAYSALAADLYAPVWNPAGLGFLESTQFGGQHLSYLESIHYEHVGLVVPLRGSGGLGFSAQYLGSGDIPGFDISGTPIPDYSSYFASYNLAYGHSLGEKLSLGLTAKMVRAKISDVGSTAYAADLGALYRLNPRTTFAATLTNFGSKLKFLNDDSSLPLAGHLAAAYVPHSRWLVSLEGVFPKEGIAGLHGGLQWRPIKYITLRTGYRTETTKELGALAGLTVGAGISAWGHELAYAWVPYGDLGQSQYVSLVMRFGNTHRNDALLIQAQKTPRGPDPESSSLPDLLNSDQKVARTR